MQRERMDLAFQLVPEQLVDDAVLRYQVLTLEVGGNDDHLEVLLRPGRNIVLSAFVDHLQMQDLEAAGKLLLDAVLHAHGIARWTPMENLGAL